MRARTAVAIGAALGVLAGVVYSVAPSAVGQGMGGGAAPLPGVDILSAPRLDATVSTDPGSCLSVAGSNDCTAKIVVTVPDPIALNSSASAMLAGQRNCSYAPLGRLTARPDGGVIYVGAGVTGVSIKAHGFGTNVDYVSCWPHAGLGPFPNCTISDAGVGVDLHNHETADFDVNQLPLQVDCRTCVHNGSPAQDNAIVTGVTSTCLPLP